MTLGKRHLLGCQFEFQNKLTTEKQIKRVQADSDERSTEFFRTECLLIRREKRLISEEITGMHG